MFIVSGRSNVYRMVVLFDDEKEDIQINLEEWSGDSTTESVDCISDSDSVPDIERDYENVSILRIPLGMECRIFPLDER